MEVISSQWVSENIFKYKLVLLEIKYNNYLLSSSNDYIDDNPLKLTYLVLGSMAKQV